MSSRKQLTTAELIRVLSHCDDLPIVVRCDDYDAPLNSAEELINMVTGERIVRLSRKGPEHNREAQVAEK